jgi:nucleoside-triphosphatase THEP1
VIIDILTGQVQSGKTTLLRKITFELDRKGVGVGGFLSLSVHDADGVVGYDLYSLGEQKRLPFLRKHGQEEWEKIGPYSFIPSTLDLAKRIVLQTERIDICFVDEVGPSELEGKGLWPALAAVLERPTPDLFLTVRTSLLEAYLDKLGKKIEGIFDVADKDVQPQIMAHLEQKYMD